MLALATVIGSVIFALFGRFGGVAAAVTVLLTMVVVSLIPLRPLEPREDERADPHAITFFSSLVLGCAVLAMNAAMLWIFWRSKTLDPIPSPWTVVPHEIFYLFPLAVLGAMIVARRTRLRNFSYLITSATLATALLPAFLLYPLGFSFDAALHRAAEQVLATVGTVHPLPIYYLGEYTLMSLLGRLTQIPIDLVGRLFLPLVTALVAPALIMLAVPPLSGGGKPLSGAGSRASARAAAIAFLLIPFGEFVMTLPQGLANLFAFAAFASGLASLTAGRSLRLPLLFTLAAAVTHPLTGIPTLIFFVFLWLENRSSRGSLAREGRWLRNLKSCAYLFGSVSLPVAFLANAWRTGEFALSFQGQTFGAIIRQLFSIESPHLRRFDFIWDTLYRFEAIVPLLMVLLAILSLRGLKDRSHPTGDHPQGDNLIKKIFGLTAAILAINFIILKYVIRFDFLPSFEQGNYSARLFGIILLLLLPLAAVTIARLFDALPRTRLAPRATLLITLALAATATLYISFPRFDAYASNHGRNTSRYDLEAASWIHIDGGPQPYLVLAPPPTSAAALKLYGFWAYYSPQPLRGSGATEAIFYYPLPVAGPLYQTYVELVEESVTQDAIAAVRTRTSVQRVYLTIPDYWTRAAEAITEAKALASRWTDIGTGKIHVFVFE